MLGIKRQSEKEIGPGRFGPYYLHDKINSGGMADIWLATDAQERPCAIRLLHTRSRVDAAARKRFVRGCKILAQIHEHPFIIGYLGHGKIKGVHYLAMEYVEGANLKLLLAQADPLLERHLGNILIDAAKALEHVHDKGFMHLDFKPENIVLNRSGEIRLLDFDLTLPRPEFPKKLSSNPGTPAYMAPEQLTKAPVDHRADIFAYGVAAYELVTLQKPFPGETAEEVLRLQLDRTDFVNPRGINPSIPLALERIILKCLEREPNKRYPFMSVVTRDLERTLYV